MRSTIFNALSISILTLGTMELGVSALAIEHPVEKRALPVLMGLAHTFGAIASSTLTSTGATVITGDCGTFPGSAITGFPTGVCTGTTSAAGTAAQNAEAACLTAYNNAKGLVPTHALAASDLGGLTLAPGVYTFPSSAASLSTILTLNGATNPNGQFIFQVTTTFAAAVNSSIVLENGAQACNVYFQVGTSASISGAAKLQGNILAYTSVAVGSAASNKGTLCALNGAVTLINNALTAQTTCST